MDRQYRLLYILAGVFFVLGGAIIFMPEDWGSKPPEKGQPSTSKLFSLKSEEVAKVELTEKGTTIVLEKADGAWKMTAPTALPVDGQKVDDLLGRLTGVDVEERNIQGKAEDLGLDEASRAAIVLTDTKGKTFRAFFGKDAPVGYSTYLQLEAGGPIQVTSTKVGDVVHRGPDDFRNKDVWALSRGTAKRVRIEGGGKSVVLRKDDHGWWLGDEGPRADKEKVDRWLSDASALQVESFLEPGSPAAIGVDPPAATLTVEDEGGTHTLALGPTADDGVKALVNGGVVQLGPDAAKLVDFDAWTATKLIPVRRFQIDLVEVQLGEKKLKLVRKDGQWSDDAGKASTVGDSVLEALEGAAADWSGTGVAGATSGWGTIVLGEGAERKEQLSIGPALPDGRHPVKDAAGGPVFLVSQAELDKVAALLP